MFTLTKHHYDVLRFVDACKFALNISLGQTCSKCVYEPANHFENTIMSQELQRKYMNSYGRQVMADEEQILK